MEWRSEDKTHSTCYAMVVSTHRDEVRHSLARLNLGLERKFVLLLLPFFMPIYLCSHRVIFLTGTVEAISWVVEEMQ